MFLSPTFAARRRHNLRLPHCPHPSAFQPAARRCCLRLVRPPRPSALTLSARRRCLRISRSLRSPGFSPPAGPQASGAVATPVGLPTIGAAASAFAFAPPLGSHAGIAAASSSAFAFAPPFGFHAGGAASKPALRLGPRTRSCDHRCHCIPPAVKDRTCSSHRRSLWHRVKSKANS